MLGEALVVAAVVTGTRSTTVSLICGVLLAALVTDTLARPGRVRADVGVVRAGAVRPVPGPGGGRRAVLRTPGEAVAAVIPSLRIRDAVHRGSTFGVATDGWGWFAAVEAEPFSSLDGRRDAAIPLPPLARLVGAAELPVTAIQVVTTSVPARAGRADAPFAVSYRELAAAASPGATASGATPRAPALDQTVLVVARFSPADAAAAARPRGDGVPGVEKALSAVLGHIAGELSLSGCASRRLDSAGLTIALADSLFPAGVPRDGTWRELRHVWQAGAIALQCWRIGPWPDLDLAALHDQLAVTGSLTVTTAVRLDPRSAHQSDVVGLLRVAAPVADLNEVSRAVNRVVSRAGGRLETLSGRQWAAVYASAPTATGAGVLMVRRDGEAA
jgi:hypothetical protein